MITLPAMPRTGRKAKPMHGCACGCGMETRSTWHPGHDGRATGWALRVERGIITIDEVPANERKGCEIMLARRAEAKQRAAAAVRKSA